MSQMTEIKIKNSLKLGQTNRASE